MDVQFFVYIMSNKRDTTLYIGVTNDLKSRVWTHKEKLIAGFTKRYNLDRLVYFEQFSSIEEAIKREKELKGWTRAKKDALIDTKNPKRRDLWNEIL